jgi:hypothetical protein
MRSSGSGGPLKMREHERTNGDAIRAQRMQNGLENRKP